MPQSLISYCYEGVARRSLRRSNGPGGGGPPLQTFRRNICRADLLQMAGTSKIDAISQMQPSGTDHRRVLPSLGREQIQVGTAGPCEPPWQWRGRAEGWSRVKKGSRLHTSRPRQGGQEPG